jgi:adenylate kinase
LTARRFCPRCGAIYNLKFDPPPDPDTCAKPDCEGELVQRDDDREETIRQRLKVYHETTSPIIGYYAELGLLRTVEGAGSTPQGVFEAIKQVLDDVRSV